MKTLKIDIQPELLTRQQVAQFLGVGRPRLERFLNAPDFPKLRIDGRGTIRVPIHLLRRWLAQQVERQMNRRHQR